MLRSDPKGACRKHGYDTSGRILRTLSVFSAASLATTLAIAQANNMSAPLAPLIAPPTPMPVIAPALPVSVEDQQARRTGGWNVVPSVNLTETYSDNVAYVPSASAQGGWITGVTPGIRIEGAGARVKGFFDYRLHGLAYSNQSQLNHSQNALNSFMTIEAMENWFFVDALANISQQNRSAFGASVTDGAAGTSSNRTETTVLQVSPYIRGKISDTAVYQLRFNGSSSRTSNGAVVATETGEWVGRIKNAPSSSRLGWALDGTSLAVHSDTVGKKEDSRIYGSLIYDIVPELHASVIYGYESSDFANSTRQSSTTPGFGLEWSPSERTQAAIVKEKRVFGDGRSLVLSHRTPLTAWRYSDQKDIGVFPNQIAGGQQSSAFGLMSDLLASSIPDPLAREQAVRTRMEQIGVHAGSNLLSGGFVTSQIFVSRIREGSALLLGSTNTVTLTLGQSDRQSIGLGTDTAVDSASSSTNIRQRHLSAAWSHRLSPLSTITLVASQLHTEDLAATSIN